MAKKKAAVRKMSSAARQSRTVQPRVKGGAEAREAAVRAATKRVKAKTSIDFVRSVRGT
jgi:hypothetical protein